MLFVVIGMHATHVLGVPGIHLSKNVGGGVGVAVCSLAVSIMVHVVMKYCTLLQQAVHCDGL